MATHELPGEQTQSTQTKKKYESPELVEHGSLEKITWGAILGPLEAPLQSTRLNS